jgi:hypothetical protein
MPRKSLSLATGQPQHQHQQADGRGEAGQADEYRATGVERDALGDGHVGSLLRLGDSMGGLV